MGRAKEQYYYMQELQANRSLAFTLGISPEDLDELQWDIHENRSKEGMLYGYVVEFTEDSPVEILNKIEGLEDRSIDLGPWAFDDETDEEEIEWDISSSDQLKVFHNHLENINILLETSFENQTKFSLYVMLYAHIIASMESFLSSTFIHRVTNSDILIRKLIETDPEFLNRKFTMNEIFLKTEGLKVTVATYLKSLIFHNLQKVIPMYRNVLGIKFDEPGWLFKAISIRHDCVHRAGYDKEGKLVSITADDIRKLMHSCEILAEDIDSNFTDN